MPLEVTGYTSILVVFGVAAILFSLYQRKKMRASENWPQVTGTITKVDLVQDIDRDSAEYSVYVLYEYVVNDSRHTGNRIELNRRSYVRKKSAQARFEEYPVNSSVVVYFNPANPGEAVLVRSAPHNILYLVLGILSLGLSSVIVLHYALRK